MSPTQSVVERYIQLKGCKFVDEIVPYIFESDISDIIRSFEIDVRIIGSEYKNKNFTSKDFCIKNGIEIFYNSRNHRFSSSELRIQQKKSKDKNEKI